MMTSGPYNTKRYRKSMKTLTFNAGATDQIPLAGPFNEIIWSIKGQTDPHTKNGAGQGIARWGRRIQVHSNKRGLVADFDSMIMLQISRTFFNVGYENDTAGGSDVDGTGGILPLSCDADELMTFTVEFGTLADMCSAGDLAGYSGVLRLEYAVINAPSVGTYWAYRKQVLGNNGVIGANATFQQPQIPIVPGYFLVGELFLTFDAPTNPIAHHLEQVRVTQADDYLIDDYVHLLNLAMSRRVLNLITAGFLIRHIPVVNSDVTQVQVINGGTPTVAPSEICYIYLAGTIVESGTGSGYRGEATLPPPQVDTPQGGAGTPIGPSSPYASPSPLVPGTSPGYRPGASAPGIVGRWR